MTTGHKLALGAVALVAALWTGHAWLADHEARIHAEAIVAADDKIMAAKNADIATRDKASAAADAVAVKAAAAVTTPQQAAQVIVKYLPAPIAQPIATVDRAALPAAVQAQLPNAPSYDILTAAQAQQVARDEISCQATGNDLTTCRADLADRTAQLTAMTQEAATWKAAAKGGTKLHRFLGVLKSAACSAGGAYAGSRVTKSDPGKGAAIGAAAGVASCSMF